MSEFDKDYAQAALNTRYLHDKQQKEEADQA